MQHLMFRLVDLIRAKPDSWVARLDAESCFEIMQPEPACGALKRLGVPNVLVEWLRNFYRFHDGQFAGLGRGVAFAPIIALAYLLSVYKKLRELSDEVIWIGDDFAVITEDEQRAREVEAAAKSEFDRLGMKISQSHGKFYVGPVSGSWSFGGFAFEQLRAHPKPGATDRLVNKVRAACADPEKATYLVKCVDGHPGRLARPVRPPRPSAPRSSSSAISFTRNAHRASAALLRFRF